MEDVTDVMPFSTPKAFIKSVHTWYQKQEEIGRSAQEHMEPDSSKIATHVGLHAARQHV